MTGRPVFIVDAVRTPIGKHQGTLSAVRPDDLLAHTLAAAIARTGVEAARVDEVIAGCANQAGEDNRNVARMALLLADFPESVPGFTVNRLCASGLVAINQGARLIACGDADIVLAGGVESMSRAPWVCEKSDEAWARGNRTLYDTSLGWRFPNPRLAERFPLETMGETAENLATQLGIGREAQDLWAERSHQRACAAEKSGLWQAERVAVPIPQKKGAEPLSFTRDEGPRSDSSVSKLKTLKPAFRKEGSVTAGNASTLNDGAAVVVLMSEKGLTFCKKPPLARWVGAAAVGVDPRIMGIGPVPAIERLFARFHLKREDIDRYEINEAFAAQVLGVMKQLQLESLSDRINVNGGAIALGHPLGASGARIATTLLHELTRNKLRRGIASLCVGVGQGEATLFEAC